MIRQFDKSRFNIPLSRVLRPEIAWYATADDTVLGVVLDLDEGYSWLVLTESDQGQGFAAIDTGGSLTEEDATAALHDAHAVGTWPVTACRRQVAAVLRKRLPSPKLMATDQFYKR